MRLLIEAAYLWQRSIHGLCSSHLEPITAIAQEQSSLLKPSTSQTLYKGSAHLTFTCGVIP